MSLKAKLEAVIYAAEEPVTLAQLAALFATEALDWKAEREAALAVSVAQDVGQQNQNLLLVGEGFPGQSAEEPEETALVDLAGEDAAGDVLPSEVAGEPATPAAIPEAETTAGTEPAADAEAEARKLARQRDREVRGVLRALLDELIAGYAGDDRGIEIKEIAGGYRMATKPECHDAARMFVKSLKPALKLSLPALETLAVIAYKQPVTAPEVNEIRGVDSSGVFGGLLARKLIATAGRKQVIGRPILYKTTKEFLLRFGLKDVNELPSMEEFEKIAQMEFEAMEPAEESEAAEGAELEVDDLADEAVLDEAAGEQSEIAAETAGTADGNNAQAEVEPEPTEMIAETPATHAETTPAEAASAGPSSPEQAETETVPNA